MHRFELGAWDRQTTASVNATYLWAGWHNNNHKLITFATHYDGRVLCNTLHGQLLQNHVINFITPDTNIEKSG